MSTRMNSASPSTHGRLSPAWGDTVREALDLLATSRDEIAEVLGLSPPTLGAHAAASRRSRLTRGCASRRHCGRRPR
jgi:hypothetical protein